MYHDDNERDAAVWLSSMGLNRDWWIHPLMSGVIGAFVTIIILFLVFKNSIAVSKFDAAALVVAITGGFIGFNEWRSCRYENSIEKFYERLAESNKTLMDPSVSRLIFEADEVCESKAIMYVYGELDNLDYVIQKYRNWLMNAQQTQRGLTTFQERLVKTNFMKYLDTHCSKNLGYCHTLWEVVENLRKQ